jgi:hypothetical protein
LKGIIENNGSMGQILLLSFFSDCIVRFYQRNSKCDPRVFQRNKVFVLLDHG